MWCQSYLSLSKHVIYHGSAGNKLDLFNKVRRLHNRQASSKFGMYYSVSMIATSIPVSVHKFRIDRPQLMGWE